MTIIIDLETSWNGPSKDPNAYCKENYVARYGARNNDNGQTIITPSAKKFMAKLEEWDYKDQIIVGHAMKFDLMYLIREFGVEAWLEPQYIDTQNVYYLYSGQKERMISLDKLAEKLGLGMSKTLNLGEYVEAGLSIEDVDPEELDQYLHADLYITDCCYQIMHDAGMIFHVGESDYVLSLAEMELNGLPLDTRELTKLTKAAAKVEKELEEELMPLIRKQFLFQSTSKRGLPPKEEAFNAFAPRTLSMVFTGIPERAKLNSYTHMHRHGKTAPMLSPHLRKEIWGTYVPDNEVLGFPVDADVLGKIAQLEGEYKELAQIAALVLQLREVSKLLNTYLLPFKASINERDSWGDRVYPSLNLCVTATARLSSSSPNGQNLPPAARMLVKSKKGKVAEIDFSQLEIVAAAILSEDKQLREDLAERRDIHFELGKNVFKWKTKEDMTEEQRRVVKAVVFGSLYGGSAKGLSKNAGVPVNVVKDIISDMYSRYPGLEDWQEATIKQVEEFKFPSGHDSKGNQMYESIIDSGGLKYHFKQYPTPKYLVHKKGPYSFKPTEIKNRPIQGYAGRKIVLTYLTFMHRLIHDGYPETTDFLLTVHDSILIDTSLSAVPIREVCNTAETLTKRALDIPDNIPLSVKIKQDTNWR